jgi:hypothetical protein
LTSRRDGEPGYFFDLNIETMTVENTAEYAGSGLFAPHLTGGTRIYAAPDVLDNTLSVQFLDTKTFEILTLDFAILESPTGVTDFSSPNIVLVSNSTLILKFNEVTTSLLAVELDKNGEL